MASRLLTRDQMTDRLKDLKQQGWIKSLRPLNSGGIGNTIDALLGLQENNLPIADTAQWELKSHRVGSSSLLTLFHMEPEPREHRLVPQLLLPSYGWADQIRENELSFRQTLRATQATDRGFGISVNQELQRVEVYFDAGLVQENHSEWLESVRARVGLGPLNPGPYWNLQDLFLKAQTKMLNSFYVQAETRRSNGEEFFAIKSVLILQGFNIDDFLAAIGNGEVLVDFDARTHHNHGTKFRLRQNVIPTLYRFVDEAIS